MKGWGPPTRPFGDRPVYLEGWPPIWRPPWPPTLVHLETALSEGWGALLSISIWRCLFGVRPVHLGGWGAPKPWPPTRDSPVHLGPPALVHLETALSIWRVGAPPTLVHLGRWRDPGGVRRTSQVVRRTPAVVRRTPGSCPASPSPESTFDRV